MDYKLLRNLIITIALVSCFQAGYAQTSTVKGVRDYSDFPYWIDMMQDPGANFYEVQKAFYTYWQGRDITRGSGYKPFKRWEYYWQFRINPDGTFPEPDKVYREYQKYIESHPVPEKLKSGQPTWVELGPKTRQNYGGYTGVGRVNAIAFHPTDTATVYVGAPSGGFWITNDGGKTWTSHTDILPTLGVSAILVDQDHPATILAGTGDRDGGNAPGMGVFRSDDGGITWRPYNNGMGNVTVGMFARAVSDPNFILAAANGGIFKTTDGGENWTKTSPDNSNFRDIKFRPGSTTIAYATSNSGFYRSVDGGDTWVLLPTSAGYPGGGRLVIGVSPADDSLVYLVGGASKFQGCYLSKDLGQTFTTQSDSPNILGYAYDGSDDKSQAWYDLMIHIDPFNANIVHVGGVNLWRSDDGGKTWKITAHWWGDRTNEVHADQHAFAYNPLNNRLYAGNDGGIYYTANQGASWKEISEGLGIGQLYKLGVSATTREKVTTGFQDNGSATWMGTHWVNSGGGDGMECAIDPYDSRYSYTTLYYGSITRYINNGSGRGVAGKGTNGITEDGAWVTPFLIGENDGKIMVVGYKNVWISRNIRNLGTITFTKISDNLAGKNDVNMAVLEHSPNDFNMLFAARGDGKLFRTDNLLDSGVKWLDLTSGLPSSGTPADLECHPYDPFVVYMVHGNKVYKSINKGGSWQNITGSLPNVTKKTIVYDKTSTEGLYVGTDAGVYYKDSDMEDWTLFGKDLPVSVSVTELEIYYDRFNRTDSRLRASTYGRGLWEIQLAQANAVLPPTMLTADIVDNEIELNWLAPFYSQNVTGYQVYRNGELLTTVNWLDYIDQDIEPDVTYTYQISAVYAGNIVSGLSNDASATIVAPIELPYHQNFDKSTGGWLAKYTLEGWKYGNSDLLGVPGREGKFFAANSYAAGEGVHVTDYLTTPEIDLSSFTGKTITLRFAYTMRRYRTYDKFSVQYRPAPDSAWTKLVDMRPPSVSSWMWDTTELNLPEKALTKNVQIAFFYDDSKEFAWGAAVDDVQLFLNTTGIETIGQLAALKVYPNPSQGRFTVSLQAGPGEFTIRVINITGQVIREFKKESPSGLISEDIDLSKEPKGFYHLEIGSSTGSWREKITIQ